MMDLDVLNILSTVKSINILINNQYWIIKAVYSGTSYVFFAFLSWHMHRFSAFIIPPASKNKYI